MTKVTFLTRNFPHFGPHSGYGGLAEHLTGANVEVERREFPARPPQKALPGLPRRLRDAHRRCWERIRHRNYGAGFWKLELESWRQGAGSDVVHHAYGEDTLWLTPLLKRFRRGNRPALIATLHLPPRSFPTSAFLHGLRALDALVVLSREQAAFFSRFVPTEKIAFIPHGVDTFFFSPSPELSSRVHTTDRPFRVVTVGSTFRSLSTIREICERLSGSAFPVETHVASWGFAPPPHLARCFRHRDLDDEALRDLYRSADVVFFPLEAATANNALLEALACGVPVVVNTIGGVTDYVDPRSAVLLGENDGAAFCSAIEALLRDPDRRATLAIAARARALELSWSQVAKTYARLYEELRPARRICSRSLSISLSGASVSDAR